MTGFLKTSFALGFAALLMLVTAAPGEARYSSSRTDRVMASNVVMPMSSSTRTYYHSRVYRNNAAFGAYAYSPGGPVLYQGLWFSGDGFSGCATDGNYNQIDYGAC